MRAVVFGTVEGGANVLLRLWNGRINKRCYAEAMHMCISD